MKWEAIVHTCVPKPFHVYDCLHLGGKLFCPLFIPTCWSHKGLINHHQLQVHLPFRMYILLVEAFWSLYILCSTHTYISDSSKYFYWHYRYTLLEQFLLSSLHSVSFLLWILQLPRERQSLGYYCTEILKCLLKVIMVVRGRAQSRIQVPNSQANAFPSHMKGNTMYRLRSLGQSISLAASPHHPAQCLTHHPTQGRASV